MKYILLNLLYFCVTCYCYSYEVSNNVGIEEYNRSGLMPLLELPDDTSVNDEKFTERFFALFDQAKQLVFGYLSTAELFDFVQNTDLEDYQSAAIEAFGYRFGKRPISILDKQTTTAEGFTTYENLMAFSDLEVFEKFVKLFGKHIKKLVVSFTTFESDEQLVKTFNFIKENLSENLQSFKALFVEESQLNIIKSVEFPNVKELVFIGCHFSNQNLNLSQSFPRVKRLSVTNTAFGERNWVQKYFPVLTHLQITTGSNEFTENVILNILEQCRQLTSLSIDGRSANLLRKINTKYPNIVNLGIMQNEEPSLIKRPIQMDHVERFVCEDEDNEPPSYIRFKYLKEVQWQHESDEMFLTLMKNHADQIEKFTIKAPKLTDDDLEQMGNMELLETVCFYFDSNVEVKITAQGLVNFLKSNNQIREVRLYRANTDFIGEIYNALKMPPYQSSRDEANVRFANKVIKGRPWTDQLKFLGLHY